MLLVGRFSWIVLLSVFLACYFSGCMLRILSAGLLSSFKHRLSLICVFRPFRAWERERVHHGKTFHKAYEIDPLILVFGLGKKLRFRVLGGG